MTSRAHWPVVAIVGVGMIGGSIGKAVRARRLAGRVLGIGRSAESLAAAKKTGCVTETATDLAAAADADLVVVAAGVGAIPALLDAVVCIKIEKEHRKAFKQIFTTKADSYKIAYTVGLSNKKSYTGTLRTSVRHK